MRNGMMQRCRRWCGDVITILGLDLRLLFVRRPFWIVLLILCAIYGLLLAGLTGAAEEKSRIRLAVAVGADGGETGLLLAYLEEQPVLTVQKVSREEGLQALEQGAVEAVLFVEECYEEWIVSGRKISSVDKPLTLWYRQDQSEMRILSELVAGGVLERYCLYRSYAACQKQEGLEPVSWEAYLETAGAWQAEGATGNLMDIRVAEKSPEDNVLEDGADYPEISSPGNEILYLQVVLGLFAGILMMLLYLLYASEGSQRAGFGQIGRSAQLVGDLLYGAGVLAAVGTVLLTVLLIRYQSLTDTMISGGARMEAEGILLLFVLAVSLLFLLLRTGNRQAFPAIGMAAWFLLTGLGLVRVAAVFLPEWLERIITASPAGWFVEQISLLLYR